MFGKDAAVLPLLSTTNQLDPRLLPLVRGSEFREERRHALREKWILFTSHRGVAVPGLAKARVQETPSFADLNPPAASLAGRKLEKNQ
jgi:polynucleotide 5'-kinase involved in rRNA processing